VLTTVTIEEGCAITEYLAIRKNLARAERRAITESRAIHGDPASARV